MTVLTGTSSISGLLPGKRYVVHLYGIAENRGSGYGIYLYPIRITDTSGNWLAATQGGGINWPDGNAPHSGSLVITAPSNGIIYGYTDAGSAWNMLAMQVD